MRLDLGALSLHPGGTGHFLGEGGIEAAARRGRERALREAAAREEGNSVSKDLGAETTKAISDDKQEHNAEDRSIGAEESEDARRIRERRDRSLWQALKNKFSTEKKEQEA
ncbi:hypothetical protein DTO217A2_8482 [Paecilomyces variotii]|nr:hypothetical protein DTO217A2_8482 [Paecilomyces variotii]